jgi:hypothetical protein
LTTVPTNSPAAAPIGAPAADPWSISSPSLAFWLAIQVGCMALALLHVPLAAEYTITERLMPEVLLVGQIASAAILAPLLCRSLGSLLVAAATVWPALLLSGSLAMRPMSSSLLAATGVTVWLLILWPWCSASVNVSIRSIVSAAATILAVGAPLAVYLQKEFGNLESEAIWFHATPLAAVWTLAQGGPLSPFLVATYGIIAAAGITFRLLTARRS